VSICKLGLLIWNATPSELVSEISFRQDLQLKIAAVLLTVLPSFVHNMNAELFARWTDGHGPQLAMMA
jgi:hypothetical protein